MVTKTERCSFTEFRIVPGRGRRFIAKDGRVHHLITNKARKMFDRKIKPVKLTWTTAWRAYNKKIKVDDTHKRRTKKTARVQKAVVGMSLDEIKRRKAETPAEREKMAEARQKEIKDRKLKSLKDKQQKKKAEQPKGGKKEKMPKAAAAPGGGKK